jgi:hypothetical protein
MISTLKVGIACANYKVMLNPLPHTRPLHILMQAILRNLLNEARDGGDPTVAIDYLLEQGYSLERAQRACKRYNTPE